jgi:hypothetical protein
MKFAWAVYTEFAIFLPGAAPALVPGRGWIAPMPRSGSIPTHADLPDRDGPRRPPTGPRPRRTGLPDTQGCQTPTVRRGLPEVARHPLLGERKSIGCQTPTVRRGEIYLPPITRSVGVWNPRDQWSSPVTLLDRTAHATIRSRYRRSSRLAILPGFPACHLGVPLARPQGTAPPESEPDDEGREPSSFFTP